MQNLKIKEFKADSNLLYLVQFITKEDSVTVLSYFHSCATNLMETLKKSKARRPKVNLRSFYPGTAVSFSMEVYTGWRISANTDEVTNIYCNVNFPRNMQYFANMTLIVNEIAEAELLGSKMPYVDKFIEPRTKSPRGQKKLIVKPT